jgi:1,4-dihydroxy-2-naphthoyl-CoA hydrolase
MSTAPDEENGSESPLWRREVTLGDLNALREGNMTAHLGIEFVELGPDFIRATMPVDERTVQPFGLLHGGASVALAETLGSVAAHACLPEGRTGVGLEINANHVRAMRAGHVTGTVRPVHVGRTTQVWQIRITDEGEEEEGALVCQSRLTMAVIEE